MQTTFKLQINSRHGKKNNNHSNSQSCSVPNPLPCSRRLAIIPSLWATVITRMGNCLMQDSAIIRSSSFQYCGQVWKVGERISVLKPGIGALETSFQHLFVQCSWKSYQVEPHEIIHIHLVLINKNGNFMWFNLSFWALVFLTYKWD